MGLVLTTSSIAPHFRHKAASPNWGLGVTSTSARHKGHFGEISKVLRIGFDFMRAGADRPYVLRHTRSYTSGLAGVDRFW